MGVAVMTRTSGSGFAGEGVRAYAGLDGRGARRSTFLLHQLQALHDSEAVLLVDDDEVEFFEFDAILNKGVSADDQLRTTLRDVTADVAFAILLERAREQHDAIAC